MSEVRKAKGESVEEWEQETLISCLEDPEKLIEKLREITSDFEVVWEEEQPYIIVHNFPLIFTEYGDKDANGKPIPSAWVWQINKKHYLYYEWGPDVDFADVCDKQQVVKHLLMAAQNDLAALTSLLSTTDPANHIKARDLKSEIERVKKLMKEEKEAFLSGEKEFYW